MNSGVKVLAVETEYIYIYTHTFFDGKARFRPDLGLRVSYFASAGSKLGPVAPTFSEALRGFAT